MRNGDLCKVSSHPSGRCLACGHTCMSHLLSLQAVWFVIWLPQVRPSIPRLVTWVVCSTLHWYGGTSILHCWNCNTWKIVSHYSSIAVLVVPIWFQSHRRYRFWEGTTTITAYYGVRQSYLDKSLKVCSTLIMETFKFHAVCSIQQLYATKLVSTVYLLRFKMKPQE